MLERLQSLLCNTATARREIKPGEKFAWVRDSARLSGGIKIRACANSNGHRFDQIQKLSPPDLPPFVRAGKQCLAFAHTPMTFTLPAPFRCAAVERLLLLIELI